MKLAVFWFASALCAATCDTCHRPQTAHFAESGMGRAMVAARDSDILRAHPRLTTTLGNYSYEIAGAVLTVSDGKASLRTPLAWAFGAGTVGQTFLFERDGRWYESRVSYYATLGRLDLTIGQSPANPANLLEAAGRLTTAAEAKQCFECHATGGDNRCESCHAKAEAHAARQTPMRKLGALSTEETSDFCGQCHRTWAQIAANGPRGIQNIRFQPYRLANSKCYDATNRRIRCTACHDPHAPLVTAATVYDSKCGGCHAAGACRAGKTADCVSCHMPRLELPGAHQKFTDHRIRVVKANERYPD